MRAQRVSAKELRRHLGKYLASEDVTVVVRKGQPVVLMVPVDSAAGAQVVEALRELFFDGISALARGAEGRAVSTDHDEHLYGAVTAGDQPDDA